MQIQRYRGLGVLNMRMQNKALMIKNIFKFLNKMAIPWVSLIWQEHYSDWNVPCGRSKKGCTIYMDNFKLISEVKTGVGDTIQLWNDNWNLIPMRRLYPHVFSFAVNKDISMHKARQQVQPTNLTYFSFPYHCLHPISVLNCQTSFYLSTTRMIRMFGV